MTDPTTTAPPVAKVQHTEAEEAFLNNLYAELEPQAKAAYVTFFLARTPAHLQEDMAALVEAGLPTAPPPETQAAPASETQAASEPARY